MPFGAAQLFFQDKTLANDEAAESPGQTNT